MGKHEETTTPTDPCFVVHGLVVLNVVQLFVMRNDAGIPQVSQAPLKLGLSLSPLSLPLSLSLISSPLLSSVILH